MIFTTKKIEKLEGVVGSLAADRAVKRQAHQRRLLAWKQWYLTRNWHFSCFLSQIWIIGILLCFGFGFFWPDSIAFKFSWSINTSGNTKKSHFGYQTVFIFSVFLDFEGSFLVHTFWMLLTSKTVSGPKFWETNSFFVLFCFVFNTAHTNSYHLLMKVQNQQCFNLSVVTWNIQSNDLYKY